MADGPTQGEFNMLRSSVDAVRMGVESLLASVTDLRERLPSQYLTKAEDAQHDAESIARVYEHIRDVIAREHEYINGQVSVVVEQVASLRTAITYLKWALSANIALTISVIGGLKATGHFG